MTCDQARQYLAAHLDEELDVIRDAEVVAHLNTCAACADAALAHAARRGLVRDHAQYFTAPSELAAQIRSAAPLSRPSPEVRGGVRRVAIGWLPMAASVALAAAVGYGWGVRATQTRGWVESLASGYERASFGGHAIDVASTDRHTVKPWFSGKVDFAPPVPDLAADGFPLVGGRLDQLNGRRVAVLVYQRRQHRIDVYLALSDQPAPTEADHAGFNILTWTTGEFRAAAISDLAATELKSFSELWQSQATR